MVPVMGVAEVVAKAGEVLGNLSSCKKDILAFHPDAVILVDYPGFNLRIARFAHRRGFKVYYYIPPKAWAHGAGRVRRLRRDVDVIYSIFPFEPAWFRSRGVETRYFGHPLPEYLSEWAINPLEGKYIALLPGSRSGELDFLMPRFAQLESLLAADARFAGFRLVLAAAPSISPETFRNYLSPSSRIEVVADRTYDVLSGASAALVCSGTATLEAALLDVPQVVCYGFSRLTWWLVPLFVKVRYASPVNLCLDREAVAELLQDEASPEQMKQELERILFQETAREQLRADYAELKNLLGDGQVAGRIAQDIYAETARV
jgi:lipid-A-disaccharide synthase